MTPSLLLICGISILVLVGIFCYLHYRHQRLLAIRAQLMHEAIRCKDFSFRLPTKGLFFGERALQKALNDFSREINIQMAQQEVETWQRLTRVLTHEIMNAASPICSITQAYLSDPNFNQSLYGEGIEAINKTSAGMIDFVQNFRKITNIQEAHLETVNLLSEVTVVTNLYPDIDWRINLPADFLLKADKDMLRQVFMNLVKNAIEAGAKVIDLRLENNYNDKDFEPIQTFNLLVSNNGEQIPYDVAKEIFTPFFTTKKEGSGIGLSLSRQMMMKQGMELLLAERATVPGYKVTFMLCNIQPER